MKYRQLRRELGGGFLTKGKVSGFLDGAGRE